ncbi:hypothetical protein H5399_08215 [Tessaracoccus sp. MC1627]|uniref:hypothetical protein n=1 Tax=Tessaracoccus sp. MC1627 TaxID=2760312 RepID=UPI0015FFC255|nr:hypothetical protein [Tessaracoccus sp. MC1627]MBB1512586.1 hypothetical protein [Tessaracoccus sp. MC1627]
MRPDSGGRLRSCLTPAARGRDGDAWATRCPKDDGWTAHEPSKAYVNNNDTFSTAAKFAADTAPEPETEAAEASISEVAAEEQANDGAIE